MRNSLALGEGADDGVPGKYVWFGNMVEHLESVGKVTGAGDGDKPQNLRGNM